MDTHIDIIEAILRGIKQSNPEMAQAVAQELKILETSGPKARWVSSPLTQLIRAAEG